MILFVCLTATLSELDDKHWSARVMAVADFGSGAEVAPLHFSSRLAATRIWIIFFHANCVTCQQKFVEIRYLLTSALRSGTVAFAGVLLTQVIDRVHFKSLKLGNVYYIDWVKHMTMSFGCALLIRTLLFLAADRLWACATETDVSDFFRSCRLTVFCEKTMVLSFFKRRHGV